jgi:hypothetical protein
VLGTRIEGADLQGNPVQAQVFEALPDDHAGGLSVQTAPSALWTQRDPQAVEACTDGSGFRIKGMFLDPFHRGLLTISESGVPVPGGVVPVPAGGLPVPAGGVTVGDRCPAVLPDLVQQDPDVVPLLGEDPALVHWLLPGHRCLASPRGQLTGISVGRSCSTAGNVERPAVPGRVITLASRPHPLLHRLIPQHRGLIPGVRSNVSSS